MNQRSTATGHITLANGDVVSLDDAAHVKCSEETARRYETAIRHYNQVVSDDHDYIDAMRAEQACAGAALAVADEAAAYDAAHPDHDLSTAEGRAKFVAFHPGPTITEPEPEPDEELELGLKPLPPGR